MSARKKEKKELSEEMEACMQVTYFFRVAHFFVCNRCASAAVYPMDSQALKFIQQRPDAEPFSVPVDWKALELPDYPEIVKNPMDLGTIEVRAIGGVGGRSNLLLSAKAGVGQVCEL